MLLIIMMMLIIMGQIANNLWTYSKYYARNPVPSNLPRKMKMHFVQIVYPYCGFLLQIHNRSLMKAASVNHYSNVTWESLRLQLLVTRMFVQNFKITTKSQSAILLALCDWNPPMADRFPSKRLVIRKAFSYPDVIAKYANFTQRYVLIDVKFLHYWWSICINILLKRYAVACQIGSPWPSRLKMTLWTQRSTTLVPRRVTSGTWLPTIRLAVIAMASGNRL